MPVTIRGVCDGKAVSSKVQLPLLLRQRHMRPSDNHNAAVWLLHRCFHLAPGSLWVGAPWPIRTQHPDSFHSAIAGWVVSAGLLLHA